MTTSVLETSVRATPARGAIAPSLLKAAEQGRSTAIRIREIRDEPFPPALRYLNDHGAGAVGQPVCPGASKAAGETPPGDRLEGGLWRWFVVAGLAAGYVLTGVAYFLG